MDLVLNNVPDEVIAAIAQEAESVGISPEEAAQRALRRGLAVCLVPPDVLEASNAAYRDPDRDVWDVIAEEHELEYAIFSRVAQEMYHERAKRQADRGGARSEE